MPILDFIANRFQSPPRDWWVTLSTSFTHIQSTNPSPALSWGVQLCCPQLLEFQTSQINTVSSFNFYSELERLTTPALKLLLQLFLVQTHSWADTTTGGCASLPVEWWLSDLVMNSATTLIGMSHALTHSCLCRLADYSVPQALIVQPDKAAARALGCSLGPPKYPSPGDRTRVTWSLPRIACVVCGANYPEVT